MGEAEEGAHAAYDVFINHRGPDIKRSVARVFLDRDELQGGDSISDKIKKAIKSSSVHVYAESPWCLNELLEMLHSRSSERCKIIPIFYDVKPEDLRRIKDDGPYAKAFLKHQNEGRHKGDLVQRWKDALKIASDISGMVFNTQENDLGDLVGEIVEKGLNEAKLEPLHVAEHPVGLDQAAEDFNNFLKERQLNGTTVVGIMGLDGSGKSTLVRHLYNCNLKNGATIVGIMGLDGSGKSTLVRHLYNCNLKSRKSKRNCFLSELNKKDLAVLQQKLVRHLLGDDKYSITDTTNGKRRLQTCLKGCRPVLIVLDGLDKVEQIESLLSVVRKDVLAEGSLILVTCHGHLLGDDKYSITDTTFGKRRLQTCFKGCGPVLIVLDGLDKAEQIESLLSVVRKDVLAEGSLILVTCHGHLLGDDKYSITYNQWKEKASNMSQRVRTNSDCS